MTSPILVLGPDPFEPNPQVIRAPAPQPKRRIRVGRVLLLAGVLFTIWFVPWVLTLYTGVLVYFPYKPDGHSRYIRVTGPVAAWFGADWTPRDSIPAAAFEAVVASEDINFYEHHGVDWGSLWDAWQTNLRTGVVKRGGSTITQQLVKNAFLSRNRTYFRKAREIVGALLLDLFMSKKRQLTWYFNVVEFGPRIYGIRAAARYYFHKSPERLTRSECISLVLILPRPNRWNRSLLDGEPTPFFREQYRQIERRM